MTRAAGNQRGVALVITLLVVALLTILVVEFTFSAQVDMHMARNTLTGLQASLLARSGINMGEAFLLHDDDPQVDSFVEEWCPGVGPDAQSCLIDETSGQLVVPPNMQLRVQILDEGAKFNLNLMRPKGLQVWQQYQANPDSQPELNFLHELSSRLFEGQGVAPELVDSVFEYWARVLEKYGFGQAAGGVQGNPGGTPTPLRTPLPHLWQLDLPSLDDAGVIPGLTPAVIKRLRPVLTAFSLKGALPQTNINTIPRRMLAAAGIQGDAAEEIVSRRQEAPIAEADKGALLQQAFDAQQDANLKTQLVRQFGVRSTFFLIRASAVINANPMTGKGGIGRSVSVVVRRDQKPGVAPNAPPGTPRWILTRLEWHKEGGALLFRDDALDVDGGSPGSQGLADGGVLN